ncbi:MAG TPA: tRNA modification GTPase [Planctomycetaceae bacterium]|nr:tRNA modification GTPase [Planctomycetaceae bacterium]
MPLELDEPIAAIASAPGSAARGIVRVSGSALKASLERYFSPLDPSAWNSTRRAGLHRGRFQLADGLTIDVEIGLWPTRRSYTGQPMAEIHTFGSQPLLERILDLLRDAGIRLAAPGEFTLRAFLNGRIDLVRAEAVLGVIDASAEAELQTALEQLGGGLSGKLFDLRHDLLELLSDLEAGLDFAEEDIQFVAAEELVTRLEQGREFLSTLKTQSQTRLRSDHESRVVLAGLPNAGKSTLLNALAQREAAIVSEIPGTTRDYLTLSCSFDNMSVRISDTAGWEESDDRAMQSAQKFRETQIRQADLVLWCTASDLEESSQAEDERRMIECRDAGRQFHRLRTKSDLSFASAVPPATLALSAHTGAGLAELKRLIVQQLSESSAGQRQMIGLTSARCAESLDETIRSLDHALEASRSGAGEELIAMDLRQALDGLGKILGVVHTDDILDRIFNKFCIGK